MSIINSYAIEKESITIKKDKRQKTFKAMVTMNNSLLATLLVIAALTVNVCFRSNNAKIPTVTLFQGYPNKSRITTSSSIRRRIRKLQSEEDSDESFAQDESSDEPEIESTPPEGIESDENQDGSIEEEEPAIEIPDEDSVIDEVNVDSAAPEDSEETQLEEDEAVDESAEEAVIETTDEINEVFNEEHQQPEEPQDESTEERPNEIKDETSEKVTVEESNADSVEPIEDLQLDEPQEKIDEVDTATEQENDEVKTEWQDTDFIEPESNEESQSDEHEEDAFEAEYTFTEESNEEFQSKEYPDDTAGIVDQFSSDEIQYSNSSQIQEETAEEPVVDFVIAGFPKSGTTFLTQAVLNVSQVYMGWPPGKNQEVHDLEQHENIQKFINRYDISKHPNYINDKYKYHRIYNEEKVINGFKAPMLIEHTHGLQNLFNITADIDFVMTTRHPILWFQSFWNFRARDGRKMPSPLDLIGDCDTGCNSNDSNCKVAKKTNANNVCTGTAKIHHYLARLKFTPMETQEELDLLGVGLRHLSFDFTGKMFLMEVSQMNDKNPTRMDSFRSELTEFLNLKPDTLPDLAIAKEEHDANKTPAHSLLKKYKLIDEKNLSERQKKRFEEVDMTENMDTELVKLLLDEAVETFDICEEQYAPLREILVDIGTKAATWIEDYLLKSPRVVVANESYFLQLIGLWKLDPCDEGNESVSRARERGLLQWDDAIHEGY